MPSHLGSYILSHSKRLMNEVIIYIHGFYSKNKFYGDTDSIYIHKNEWNKLVVGSFIKDGLWYGKNDYGSVVY